MVNLIIVFQESEISTTPPIIHYLKAWFFDNKSCKYQVTDPVYKFIKCESEFKFVKPFL